MFDLSSILNGVPEINTERKQIEYIDIDKLHPDPRNIYELSGLDDLMSNIELFGLQQPLEVRPHDELIGEYTISSGHRRHAALTRLIAEGHDKLQEVPCIVIYESGSAALQELRLIYANSSTRILTASETSKQIDRVTALLYELQEQGVEFPGRMRDHVAQACNISKSKLARLHAIRSNLIPELLAKFDSNELIESAAYELQKLPEEAQQTIFKAADSKKGFKVIAGSMAANCATACELFMQERKCPDGAACDHHLERFACTALSQYSWKSCDGKCCLKCYDRVSCKYLCAKAKARRSAEAADVQIAKEREEKKAERKQIEFRKQVQAQALRLIPLFEAAELKDDDKMPGGGYGGKPIREIKAFAAGEFGDAHFYGPQTFLSGSYVDLKFAAEKLNCTTDYLLGVSDEIKPVPKINTAAEWQNGTPERSGKYYCKVEVEGVSVHQILIYDKGWKLPAGGHALDECCTVLGWWSLPEE